ncbi:snRNA-activating protein complex subunit 3 isoform X2 [Takifugu flavidus]|uniref:snRNA-activating protein complex subunit 3 n=1 Tax=Takifugu flavidus TaxID=433684 RepID=A0A5C6MZ50_9TELE|nr:snRNA-activating protein complex subunit 3 isoform X2 [Takifugu flavidus]TWW58727.1 snRNA-activating protein complex subunit 3 [Takifugu flavidus]
MAASRRPSDPSTNIPDYEYQDVNTKAFHIGSFRTEWLNRLKPSDYSFQVEDEDAFDAKFAQELGVNAETMMELKSVCNVESLRCDDAKVDPEVVPPDSTLQTLVQRKEKQDLKASKKFFKNRHELYADELERLTIGKNPELVDDMVPEGELILTINVFYPDVIEKFNFIRPHAALLMMGSHTLAELRDAICCVSDLQVCGEFSNNPDAAPSFLSKDHFKSAFFYFEGVFYNDMRFPECVDISRTTIEWAESHNFPPFSQAKMEDTRFVDLNVKVGFPYLYCHQGDCEHLIIITDIRLAHRSDCLDKKLYPLLTHKHRFTTQKCSVCHVFIGRWFTTGDRLAPSDPCLFCDKCFRMLHYDTQGNKLGEFQAFPFVDRGAFN